MRCQRIAVELLYPSIVAKSKEYAVSGIVRQLNIDNFTAVCSGGSTVGLKKMFPVWFVSFHSPLTFVPFISRSVSV